MKPEDIEGEVEYESIYDRDDPNFPIADTSILTSKSKETIGMKKELNGLILVME
jgi:hypothetical protein